MQKTNTCNNFLIALLIIVETTSSFKLENQSIENGNMNSVDVFTLQTSYCQIATFGLVKSEKFTNSESQLLAQIRSFIHLQIPSMHDLGNLYHKFYAHPSNLHIP